MDRGSRWQDKLNLAVGIGMLLFSPAIPISPYSSIRLDLKTGHALPMCLAIIVIGVTAGRPAK